MKKPFVVSVSVSFLVLLAGYFFHQEITSRNLQTRPYQDSVSTRWIHTG